MKRILTGVIVVICSLSPNSLSQEKRRSEVDCGEYGTQAEANACARREYQRAQAEMNKLYGRLMTELASYKGNDQEKLRRAQALWLQYRAANCDSESSIYQNGSILPAVYNSCLASVTRERAQRLAEFLATTKQ